MFLPSMSAMERTCARLSISAEVRKKWANRNDKASQRKTAGRLKGRACEHLLKESKFAL